MLDKVDEIEHTLDFELKFLNSVMLALACFQESGPPGKIRLDVASQWQPCLQSTIQLFIATDM